MPPDRAALTAQAEDAMFRLQIQIAADSIDPDLVARVLRLLGFEAARGDRALLGHLGAALFRLGRPGPALLVTTLFFRRIETMAAMLPRDPLEAQGQRRILLSVLEPLKAVLAANDYSRAAAKLNSLQVMLEHGC